MDLLTNIEDYVNEVYNKQLRICVNHSDNNSVKFCDVCKEWLCDKCIENHQSIKCKEFLPTFPWIKYNKRTLHQKRIFYCVNCNGYLEHSEITHKDHDVINLNDYQKTINKNKIYQLIQKAETYIKIDCPFIILSLLIIVNCYLLQEDLYLSLILIYTVSELSKDYIQMKYLKIFGLKQIIIVFYLLVVMF